jgi:homoserine dehydrogenase
MPTSVRWTEEIDEVLDSDIDVLVELVGGLNPAGTWVRRALASGKSVVTANKELIAAEGVELSELACRHRQHLAYGASVAGGVPVLSGLQEGLAGDELVSVSGILNGTCNYILTRMEQAGISFSDALVRASQKLTRAPMWMATMHGRRSRS